MNSPRRKQPIVVSALLFGALLLGLAGSAQAADDVDAIIAKYIDAVGGRAALEKVTSRVMKGNFALPDMGMSAPVEMYLKPPDKVLVRIDFAEFGMAANGVSGDVAWDINPMTGPRVLSGGDRTAQLRQAAVEPLLDWKKHFAKGEVVGTEDVAGKTCTKVVLSPAEGEPVTAYFEQESGLMVRMIGSRDGQSSRTDFRDFKEVGGIRLPHKTEVYTPQFMFEITVTSVEQNVDIPDEKFNLPPDIATLVKK